MLWHLATTYALERLEDNDPEGVLDQHLEGDEVADLELVSNGEADPPLIHG